jgi:hypothetical protein
MGNRAEPDKMAVAEEAMVAALAIQELGDGAAARMDHPTSR